MPQVLLKAKERKNECGILLPLFSLPSKYGIGSLGKEAFQFVDFLNESKQNYWQILPLCPIGKGNSPYTSSCAFAGEILFIDIDLLTDDGLLKKEDIKEASFKQNIDYKKCREFKTPLLKKAAENFDISNTDFLHLCEEKSYWLEDFALFSAIKDEENSGSFLEWNDGLKYRNASVLNKFETTHKKEILFYKISQFLFFLQYNRLHRYANEKGIKIIGDMPFYVSLESSDVWGNSKIFKLGKDLTPLLWAGVPPDIFSSDGQLWENPIYDWEYLKTTDYDWWKKRILHNRKLYDIIRIDHFRAFADYYTVPTGSNNATYGKWEKGVGMGFWGGIKPLIKGNEIIAEDLGGEDSSIVQKLISDTGFPNMKVLQFAFNSDSNNLFLPKNFGRNCVCYTGTHDNDTTLGWYKNLKCKERIMFESIVPRNKFQSPTLSLISFAMNSKAKIAIIPLQDYLELDSQARVNTPGTTDGNWVWRFSKNDITKELTKTIIKLSKQRK